MILSNNKLNEQRVRRYFAILPIRIGSTVKWLETVEFVQEWYKPFEGWGWHNQKFIDETNQKHYSTFKRYGRFKLNFL